MQRFHEKNHLFLVTDSLSLQKLQLKNPEFKDYELNDPLTNGQKYLTDGQVCWYNDEKERAVPSFLKAEKLIYKAFDKEPRYALYKLCEAYYRMEFYERAVELFMNSPSVEEIPPHIRHIVNSSLKNIKSKGSMEHLKKSRELLQYYPSHWAAHSNFALANYNISKKLWGEKLYDDSLQKSQNAVDIYKKAVTLLESQDNKTVETNAGNLNFLLGKCFIEHATNMAVIKIKDADNLPTVTYAKTHETVEALAQGRFYLHKSKDYGYDHPELYKFLGRAESSFAEPFLAIKYFEEARKMKPNDAENLYFLYLEYLSVGNKNEATKCLWSLNSPIKY